MKNNVIAVVFLMMVGLSSVGFAGNDKNVTDVATEISAARKKWSDACHLAALASIVPSTILGIAVAVETEGKTFFDKIKMGACFAIPLMLQITSDRLAKNNLERSCYNAVKLFAFQAPVLVGFFDPLKEKLIEKIYPVAAKFANLGK